MMRNMVYLLISIYIYTYIYIYIFGGVRVGKMGICDTGIV